MLLFHQEYWSVLAEFKQEGGKQSLHRQAMRVDKKDQMEYLTSKAAVDPLDDEQRADYSIDKIKRGERRRKPICAFYYQHPAARSFSQAGI